MNVNKVDTRQAVVVGRVWVVCLLLLLCAQAPAQAQAPGAACRPDLPCVEEVRFESRLVGKSLPYKVLLPAGYDAASAKLARFPVLYLLHGLTGHYTDWLARTRLADYAAKYQLIIVTPEGNNGWYTDSAGVPGDRYESYVVRELIPDVERRYRAITSRDGRAVAGLSMGGYGALKFGVKYPEQFTFAASMSGAVGAASWRTEEDLPPVGLLRQSLRQTFGPPDGEVKRANDLFRLVREMPPARARQMPFLYLDCGTEDQLRLLAPNRALAELLVEKKIAHEFRQLPGDHNWAYWGGQVQEVLRLAARRLTMPLSSEN